MWGISPYDNNSQINAFKANYGQTFPSAGTQGGGVNAKNVIISGQTFYGYPTYAVICPDKTIHFDICWPPSLNCFNNYIGQCVPPIIADFSADNTNPEINETVHFTDLTSNSPNAWNWSFNPSSVSFVNGTSASSQNPQVQFNNSGSYTVTLNASNSQGSDSETKLNYIYAWGTPIANFEADNTMPATGQTVSFTDLSDDNPTSWSWSFTPSTVTYVEGTNSSSQNPKVEFNNIGIYSVSLTASNVHGSDNETKTNYIDATLYCGASGAWDYPHITSVQMGTIDNSSGQDYYADYTDISTDLNVNQYYDITVTNGFLHIDCDLGVWIDWNQDNDFDDVDENVVCEISNNGQGIYGFTVPASALPGQTRMRIRNKYYDDDCGSPCGVTIYGEVEDYSVNVIPDIDPPVADFSAATTAAFTGETVIFTDLSSNSPTSWSWSFNPPTVTYAGITNSNSPNPHVQFDATGNYTVELTVTNDGGSDTEIKVDYIAVSNPIVTLNLIALLEGPFNGIDMEAKLGSIIPQNQPFNTSPWNYPGSESVTSLPNADVVDWVLIDIRDAVSASTASTATSIGRKAAFVLKDGSVVDLDGSSPLIFPVSVTQNLFVAIWHRNHIGIMSNYPLAYSGGQYEYDFSTDVDQVYGLSSGHKELASGKWGMISGDGNPDGLIDASDISTLWETESGTHGYLPTDYNLDGESNNIDKDDFWVPNEGQGTAVPN